jgi:NAD+ kinase
MTLEPVRHVALRWSDAGERAESLVGELSDLLHRRGIRVSHGAAVGALAEGPQLRAPDAAADLPDLAIVIGNDRAVLAYARQIARQGIALLGISHDRLGFLGALSPSDALTSVQAILEGELQVESRTMLDATIRRSGAQAFSELALNDIVVTHSAGSRLIDLQVEIDGERAFDLRADGVVIATPTGSTAYCLSAGGPVVHPGVPAWTLSPVAAHTLTNRPLVLPLASIIRITVSGGQRATVNADGLAAFQMGAGESLELRQAEVSARFVHPRNWSYFGTLRQKLGWSLGQE